MSYIEKDYYKSNEIFCIILEGTNIIESSIAKASYYILLENFLEAKIILTDIKNDTLNLNGFDLVYLDIINELKTICDINSK